MQGIDLCCEVLNLILKVNDWPCKRIQGSVQNLFAITGIWKKQKAIYDEGWLSEYKQVMPVMLFILVLILFLILYLVSNGLCK